MNLFQGEIGKQYIIKKIETQDEELDVFLFTLGCYSGEPINKVSQTKNFCIVYIKDARYSIDKELAQAIILE